MWPMGFAKSVMFGFRWLIVPRFVYCTRDDFTGTDGPGPEIRGRVEQLAAAAVDLARVPARVRANYLQELEKFVDGIRQACAKAQVDYVLVNTRDPVEQTITNYLLQRTAQAKIR